MQAFEIFLDILLKRYDPQTTLCREIKLRISYFNDKNFQKFHYVAGKIEVVKVWANYYPGWLGG